MAIVRELLADPVRATGTSAVLAYTVPRGQRVKLLRVSVANNTGVLVTFRLYINKYGKDATALDIADAEYYDKSVAANDTFVYDAANDQVGIPLGPGYTVVFQSGTANALSLKLWGERETPGV